VGIAAQLRRPAELRESDLEIAKKPAGHESVVGDGGGPQGQGESLDVSFQDLFEAGGGLAHETSGGVNTARAYWRPAEIPEKCGYIACKLLKSNRLSRQDEDKIGCL
jgi:hypothetical protein